MPTDFLKTFEHQFIKFNKYNNIVIRTEHDRLGSIVAERKDRLVEKWMNGKRVKVLKGWWTSGSQCSKANSTVIKSIQTHPV